MVLSNIVESHTLLNGYFSKKHRLFESESYFVQLPGDLDMTCEHFDVDTIEFGK